MSQTVAAIYEQGVLRLLTPLRLPERTRVQVQIITPAPTADEECQRVLQALLNAGVIRPRPPAEHISPVSETQLAAAACALAVAGPLSEPIIVERDGR